MNRLPDDKKKLPLMDKITLGPIKKYKNYNRFPWKMMVHIVLVMVVTTQIVLVIQSSGGYSRSEEAFFFQTFLNDQAEYNGVDFEKNRNFYSINEVREFINKSIDSYFNIEEADTFEVYNIPREFNDTTQQYKKSPVSLDIFYIRGHRRDQFSTISYDIDPNNLGPFDEDTTSVSDFRSLVSNSTHFRLVYTLRNTIPSVSIGSTNCFLWSIFQEFDFTLRNVLVLEVHTTRQF